MKPRPSSRAGALHDVTAVGVLDWTIRPTNSRIVMTVILAAWKNESCFGSMFAGALTFCLPISAVRQKRCERSLQVEPPVA